MQMRCQGSSSSFSLKSLLEHVPWPLLSGQKKDHLPYFSSITIPNVLLIFFWGKWLWKPINFVIARGKKKWLRKTYFLWEEKCNWKLTHLWYIVLKMLFLMLPLFILSCLAVQMQALCNLGVNLSTAKAKEFCCYLLPRDAAKGHPKALLTPLLKAQLRAPWWKLQQLDTEGCAEECLLA